MNKICPRCRAIYEYNSTGCPNGCNKRVKRESDKVYDQKQRKNQEFYSSKAWKKLREICKEKFSGLCIWSYYKHKKIIKGRVTHHIIPMEIDETRALDLSNLIYLSDEAHAEIHKRYVNTSVEEFNVKNEEILKEIDECIQLWKLEEGGI